MKLTDEEKQIIGNLTLKQIEQFRQVSPDKLDLFCKYIGKRFEDFKDQEIKKKYYNSFTPFYIKWYHKIIGKKII